MQGKEFECGSKTYRIELLDGGEIKMFEHIDGRQKEVIVEKLASLIAASDGADFAPAVVDYIKNYEPGNKDSSRNTRSLGKILFDRL